MRSGAARTSPIVCALVASCCAAASSRAASSCFWAICRAAASVVRRSWRCDSSTRAAEARTSRSSRQTNTPAATRSTTPAARAARARPLRPGLSPTETVGWSSGAGPPRSKLAAGRASAGKDASGSARSAVASVSGDSRSCLWSRVTSSSGHDGGSAASWRCVGDRLRISASTVWISRVSSDALRWKSVSIAARRASARSKPYCAEFAVATQTSVRFVACSTSCLTGVSWRCRRASHSCE